MVCARCTCLLALLLTSGLGLRRSALRAAATAPAVPRAVSTVSYLRRTKHKTELGANNDGKPWLRAADALHLCSA